MDESSAKLSTAGSSTQEGKLGDPCALRLVVKNATTLVEDRALVQATENQMQGIIRQLQLLDGRLDMAAQGDAEAAQSVPALLQQAIDANVQLEASVTACLGLT